MSDGVSPETLNTDGHRQRAEEFVLSKPLLRGLGEIAQNPGVYRLTWMLDEVDQVVSDHSIGHPPFARWCNIGFTHDPMKRIIEGSMLKRVMAVIGTKQADGVDLELVFTTPTDWQGYLAEYDRLGELDQAA